MNKGLMACGRGNAAMSARKACREQAPAMASAEAAAAGQSFLITMEGNLAL